MRRPNGCTLVPDFGFTKCCDAHDLDYMKGGNELDRWRADMKFLKCMLKRKKYKCVSLAYYFGVVLFGWAFFCYGSSRSLVEYWTTKLKKENKTP